MSDDFQSIKEATADMESAIQEGDPRLWPVFLKYRDNYVHDLLVTDPAQNDKELVVQRYLMIASLYAACFLQKGDKANRDKVAQSCTLFMTAMKRDPIGMLEEFHRIEDFWTGLLRKEGLAPRSGCGAVACVVLLAVAVSLALA